MSEPSGHVPPQAAPKKASRTRIILMLLLGGPVLAVGGCALFLSTLNFNGSRSDGILTPLGAIGFIAGVLAAIVGGVWGLVRFIGSRFDKAK